MNMNEPGHISSCSVILKVIHREKDLEEAVLHVPNKPANSGVHARHTSLSSRVSLESTPACTTDLADELEHVERAGPRARRPDDSYFYRGGVLSNTD